MFVANSFFLFSKKVSESFFLFSIIFNVEFFISSIESIAFFLTLESVLYSEVFVIPILSITSCLKSLISFFFKTVKVSISSFLLLVKVLTSLSFDIV